MFLSLRELMNVELHSDSSSSHAGRKQANFSPFSRAGLRWAFFTTEIVPHWAQSWLRPDNAPTVEYDGGPMGERL